MAGFGSSNFLNQVNKGLKSWIEVQRKDKERKSPGGDLYYEFGTNRNDPNTRLYQDFMGVETAFLKNKERNKKRTALASLPKTILGGGVGEGADVGAVPLGGTGAVKTLLGL